jgi:hypothetical protein
MGHRIPKDWTKVYEFGNWEFYSIPVVDADGDKYIAVINRVKLDARSKAIPFLQLRDRSNGWFDVKSLETSFHSTIKHVKSLFSHTLLDRGESTI